jgi:hypothetical protein
MPVAADVPVLDHHDALATAVARHYDNTLIDVPITALGASGNPPAGKRDRPGRRHLRRPESRRGTHGTGPTGRRHPAGRPRLCVVARSGAQASTRPHSAASGRPYAESRGVSGGTHTFGATPTLARLLTQIGAAFDAVVVAADDRLHDQLLTLAPSRVQRIEVIAPTDELPELLADADLVVSASGTSTWEAALPGDPGRAGVGGRQPDWGTAGRWPGAWPPASDGYPRWRYPAPPRTPPLRRCARCSPIQSRARRWPPVDGPPWTAAAPSGSPTSSSPACRARCSRRSDDAGRPPTCRSRWTATPALLDRWRSWWRRGRGRRLPGPVARSVRWSRSGQRARR